jgi:hypothetical protein
MITQSIFKKMGFWEISKEIQNGGNVVNGAEVNFLVFGNKSSCVWPIFQPGTVLERSFKVLIDFNNIQDGGFCRRTKVLRYY